MNELFMVNEAKIIGIRSTVVGVRPLPPLKYKLTHFSFSKKMAAAASFSYKISGGGLIFLQNWRRRRPHFPTKLAGRQGFGNISGAVLTWSGYWSLGRK